jgi:DNA polymerase (family 10)
MSKPDKFAIARTLREIGMLLELKGENRFKARAYETGAAALEAVAEDVGTLIEQKRLTKVQGIGEKLATSIIEIYKTGKSSFLERLHEEMPPGIIELSQIKGMSPKRVQQLQESLKITTIAELKAACQAGKISEVPGFGKKTEQNILQAIDDYENREDVILLVDARELADRLVDYMEGVPSVKVVEIGGSIRRWKETVADIDIAVGATDMEAAMDGLEQFPLTASIEFRKTKRMRVRLATGLRVDMLVCRPEEITPALFMQTGSRLHNEKLLAIASNRNLTLDERGVWDGPRRLPVKREADIYEHLGFPYVPPELREDEGEIEAALAGENFDDLIDEKDVQGMVHCHTVYSDGRRTIEEMARAAEKMGMKYLTITDHSPAAFYAGGLEPDRLKKQWAEIEEVQDKVGIKLLRGTESDILADGSLDYPDSILEKFDVIVASVHQRFKMDEDKMTERIIRCMKLPYFKIWGHALGRLVLRRPPFAVRMDEVLDVIAESKAAIEVNGDPYRLDMAPEWIREARKRGIKFVISTDAHAIRDLYNLPYGVHIARRGGIRKSEVLNALPVTKFQSAVRP